MTSHESFFLSGDIVIQNPKESAVIFSIVVVLSVVLENVFAYFRNHRSTYARGLFQQVSEEIMIVGTIGLFFVMIVQSFKNLPESWVTLFRWTQTVIFFMMLFFVIGILVTALVTRLMVNALRKFEVQVYCESPHVSSGGGGAKEPSPHPVGGSYSTLQRSFLALRSIFFLQLKFQNIVSHSMRELMEGSELLCQRRQQEENILKNASGEEEQGTTEEENGVEMNPRSSKRARLLSRSATSRTREMLAMPLILPQAASTSAATPSNSVLVFHQSSNHNCAQDLPDSDSVTLLLAKYVPFGKYLDRKIRATVVGFADVTWQSWLSLIFASALNSVRLFLLPGDLQSKKSKEYTANDRIANQLSFIFILGYGPLLIFLISFVCLLKNFFAYLAAADVVQQKTRRPVAVGGTKETVKKKPKSKTESGSVWLPPKQLLGQLEGEVGEDPSRYLLRGNRSFTLHMMKVPALVTEFYFAIFVVGMAGELATEVGKFQIIMFPLAFAPFVVVLSLLPVALLAVTCLTSLGIRVDKNEVYRIAVRHARIATDTELPPILSEAGDEAAEGQSSTTEAMDLTFLRETLHTLGLGAEHSTTTTTTIGPHGNANTNNGKDNEPLQLHLRNDSTTPVNEIKSTAGRRDSTFTSYSHNDSFGVVETEMRTLKQRVKVLENRCLTYGVPLSGGEDVATTSGEDSFSAGAMQEAVTQINEQTEKILQLEKVVAQQERELLLSRSAVEAPHDASSFMSNNFSGNVAQFEAIAAARRYQSSSLEVTTGPQCMCVGGRKVMLPVARRTPQHNNNLRAVHIAASGGRDPFQDNQL